MAADETHPDPLDDAEFEDMVREGGQNAARKAVQFLLLQMWTHGVGRVLMTGVAMSTHVRAIPADGYERDWKPIRLPMSEFRELFARWGSESRNGDEFPFAVNTNKLTGRVSERERDVIELEIVPEGAKP